MDYMIEYWKGEETDPVKFLSHFRCTTEPIGGGTEFDASGELVSYDAAIASIDIAKENLKNKACQWLKDVFIHINRDPKWNIQTNYFDSMEEMIEVFTKNMEEQK